MRALLPAVGRSTAATAVGNITVIGSKARGGSCFRSRGVSYRWVMMRHGCAELENSSIASLRRRQAIHDISVHRRAKHQFLYLRQRDRTRMHDHHFVLNKMKNARREHQGKQVIK